MMTQAPQINSTTKPADVSTRRTALVLGGGGSTGNAWLIGLVAGLFEGGLDVTETDLTIGTSAGATAAAQLAGAEPPRKIASDHRGLCRYARLSPRNERSSAGAGRGF